MQHIIQYKCMIICNKFGCTNTLDIQTFSISYGDFSFTIVRSDMIKCSRFAVMWGVAPVSTTHVSALEKSWTFEAI